MVGFGGLGEGKLFADNWAESAVFQAGIDGGVDDSEFGRTGVEKHHSVYGGVTRHGVARGDFDFAATADDDDAGIGREDSEVFPKVDVGKHFEDDVGAAAVGEAGKFLEVVRGAVVEDVIGALVEHEFAAFVGAAGADDAKAVNFAPLDGRGADAAA